MEIDLTGQIGICRHGTTMISRLIEWFTDSTCHHAVVAVSPTHCVSAEPRGVRLRPISDFKNITFSRFDLSETEKAGILAAAKSSLKLPYNFAVYPVLAVRRLTHTPVPKVVSDWLERRRNVNCSQLVAQIYSAAGNRLFTVAPVIVTPGDVERVFNNFGFINAESYDLAA